MGTASPKRMTRNEIGAIRVEWRTMRNAASSDSTTTRTIVPAV